MKKGFLFIAATIAFLTACQKEDHLSLREEGIVKGSWKIKARDTFDSGKPSGMGYDTLSKLERLTRYRFFQNGDMARISTYMLDTFRIVDSAVTGKWILQDADTKLTITEPNLIGSHRFTGYNDSLMTLVSTMTQGDSDSLVITTILRRQ